MELNQLINDEEQSVHSVRRDDGRIVVADFGPGADQAAVDVVGDTAIVMYDGEQTDLELPESAERVFIRNGVLTIELEDDE